MCVCTVTKHSTAFGIRNRNANELLHPVKGELRQFGTGDVTLCFNGQQVAACKRKPERMHCCTEILIVFWTFSCTRTRSAKLAMMDG